MYLTYKCQSETLKIIIICKLQLPSGIMTDTCAGTREKITFIFLPELDIEASKKGALHSTLMTFNVDDLLDLGPILYSRVNRLGLNVKVLFN